MFLSKAPAMYALTPQGGVRASPLLRPWANQTEEPRSRWSFITNLQWVSKPIGWHGWTQKKNAHKPAQCKESDLDIKKTQKNRVRETAKHYPDANARQEGQGQRRHSGNTNLVAFVCRRC